MSDDAAPHSGHGLIPDAGTRNRDSNRPWPPKASPPAWEEVEAALGSDTAAYDQDEYDVTMTTAPVRKGKSLPACVTRSRKKGGVRRMEMLSPVRMVQVVKPQQVLAWGQGGWQELTSSGGAAPGTGASAATYPDSVQSPPKVAWSTLPGCVEVTLTRLRITEILVVDWGRKVRIRRALYAANGEAVYEELWEEKWWKKVRIPLKCTHHDLWGSGMNFTATYVWSLGGERLAADDLVAEP